MSILRRVLASTILCAACSARPAVERSATGLAPTIVSVADGLWSDPATWSPSRVPVAGDVAEVAHVVEYDVAPVELAGVIVEGTLRFTPSTSRELRSTGNVVVHGDLEMQPATAAVQHTLTFVGVDEDVFVGGGMQVLDTDVGLWVEHMGRFVATGAAKVPWTRLTGSVAAGAEGIVVEDATGWEVGDEIVIVPTVPPSLVPSNHSAWEGYDRTTIGSIAVSGPGSSRSIKLDDAMQYAHPEVDGSGARRSSTSPGTSSFRASRRRVLPRNRSSIAPTRCSCTR